MGRKNRSQNTQIYQQRKQRVYVKGDKKKTRQEMLSDLAARIIAMLFYPIYVLAMKGLSIKKSIRERLKKNSKTDNPKQTSTELIIEHKTVNQTDYIKSGSFISKMKEALAEKSVKAKHAAKNLSTSVNVEKIKSEKFKDIGQRYFTYINRHKVAVTGVIAVLAVGIVGFSAMSGLTPKSSIEADAIQQKQVVNVEEAVASLADKPYIEDLDFASIRAYEITVNDHVIAYFKTKAECQTVLDELMGMYTTDTETEILESYFAEQVEIVEGYESILKFDGYDDVDTMLSYIVKGTKEEKTHVVEKGENYWVIANYYGISADDLVSANPDIKPETLQIGQVISLVVPKPIIGVCTVEKAEYNDTIPYEIAYEDTSNLYKGESSVKVKGVAGERAVVASIVKENGREISRTILEEEVLSEPTTKVVYKGTKDPPPRMGTGVLKKPTSRGSITSSFGYRWGTRHEGIDIGLPVGSEVRASDGGVVTYAGYSSSYGYYIKINHGGNIETRYAHLSKLLVSAGDKVYQGQLIAYSGNTGRSTGPHLHFEVRINGTPVDPTKYVKY